MPTRLSKQVRLACFGFGAWLAVGLQVSAQAAGEEFRHRQRVDRPARTGIRGNSSPIHVPRLDRTAFRQGVHHFQRFERPRVQFNRAETFQRGRQPSQLQIQLTPRRPATIPRAHFNRGTAGRTPIPSVRASFQRPAVNSRLRF